MIIGFNAFDLAKDYYSICKTIRLPPYAKDQLLRASFSVALNLAEGSGKRTRNDKRRFFSIAFGSIRECQAICQLEGIDNKELLEIADKLGAILFKLSRETFPISENNKAKMK
ncbi:MAG: four helix bundle protein [Bdellovibrionota bacterium]